LIRLWMVRGSVVIIDVGEILIGQN
jgi:hypothetical protein